MDTEKVYGPGLVSDEMSVKGFEKLAQSFTGDRDEDLHWKKKKWEQERVALTHYLLIKFENEDWHAVQDAASDLRDIDSHLNTLQLILKKR